MSGQEENAKAATAITTQYQGQFRQAHNAAASQPKRIGIHMYWPKGSTRSGAMATPRLASRD